MCESPNSPYTSLLMSRRPNIEPAVHLNLALPEGLRTKIDILLWSEVEKCVPRGAYRAFFISLLTEHFDRLASPPEKPNV